MTTLSTDSAAEQRTVKVPELGSGIFGPIAVVMALVAAISTFFILMDLTALRPDETTVWGLLILNVTMIGFLITVIGIETFGLMQARRSGMAGARLHTRVVSLFSLLAVGPVILVAAVGLITLDKGLDPWFSGNLRQLVNNSGIFVREYQQQLCQNIGRESQLMARDLEAASANDWYTQNRQSYRNFMTSRAYALGFPYAVLISRDSVVLDRADVPTATDPLPPGAEDFQAAETNEPPCLISTSTIASLLKLKNFTETYLYVARPVNEQAIEFGLLAQAGIQQYQELETRRQITQVQTGLLFALITLIVLLSAFLMGLRFANRLVRPIRQLIHATDQVSTGNLYVQVPVRRADGDLGHLGATFNKMTSELRSQHNRLLAASDQMDRRRRFIEALLAGVPAGVIGLDERGVITLINPMAERIIGVQANLTVGKSLAEALPVAAPMVSEALLAPARLIQQELHHTVAGKDRTLSVRVASEKGREGRRGYVVTLDDITDLVQAQRTSAWADVARRIAHEIKNPLTPIQLAAERIRRRYGKVIGDDREVFDQCTDTIIRQVDDIKRMVDEFSSFARMPKPKPEEADLCDTLRQILFMMRVAHPEITFADHLPKTPLMIEFDRRLVGQAVQNIIKNAAEAIDAVPAEQRPPGKITLELVAEGSMRAVINVIDNGKGLPQENRQRLLEPYMTTREGGTGLGLPIVAKIFEEHGGGIELLDNPAPETGAPGACVRLWLPLKPPATLTAEAPSRELRDDQRRTQLTTSGETDHP